MLGLRLVCAGKASEYDVVWDPEIGTAAAKGRSWHAPSYRDVFAADDVGAFDRGCPEWFSRSSAADLCEMGIVTNHSGLAPDRPDLHAPIARGIELPALFRPVEEGGLLERTGVVDMFNCLRRRDEMSFAGGVFATVEAPDRATGALLAGKGIPASPDHRYFLVHNPVHLLGLEVAATVLSASRLHKPTGSEEVLPNYDLIARARRDLAPGEVLSLDVRHEVAILDHQLQPACALGPGTPVPYYLIAGKTVRRPVAAGSVLTCNDVDIDHTSTIYRLRQEQDTLFLSPPENGSAP